jgi:hypothetical protein
MFKKKKLYKIEYTIDREGSFGAIRTSEYNMIIEAKDEVHAIKKYHEYMVGHLCYKITSFKEYKLCEEDQSYIT